MEIVFRTANQWSGDCPAPEDRLETFREWSCDEYDTFMKLQLAFDINVLLVKTIQIIIYGWLGVRLIRQRCSGIASIGWKPTAIAVTLVVNGLIPMLQMKAIDHYYFNVGDQSNFFAIVSFCADCTFYIALWLFGSLMLETALDIERMMLEQQEEQSEHVQRRTTLQVKRNFKIANVCGLLLIVIFHLPILAAFLESDLSHQTRNTISYIGVLGQAVIVVTTTIFMFITLIKLRAVHKRQQTKKLNRWLTVPWFLSTFVWAACWFAIFFTHSFYKHN